MIAVNAKQTPQTRQNLTKPEIEFSEKQMHDPQTTAAKLAKAAAHRWLERSKTAEYADQKQRRKRIQWEFAALKRKLKREKNYKAIALLPHLETAMLSHLKNCDDCHTLNLDGRGL